MNKNNINVLAIDTATTACSIALLKDDFIAGEFFMFGQKNYSEKVLNLIDTMFSNTGTRPEDIDLIGVSTGPGSFTGLRVGISTAQGVAFTLGVNLVGISSLDALAFQARGESGYVCPMIDARKKEIFTSLYSCSKNGITEKVLEDTVIEPGKWLSCLRSYQPVLFLGSGAYNYSMLIKEVFENQYKILPVSDGMPRASSLAVMAKEKSIKGQKNELFNIVPAYVRQPDAVINKRGIYGGKPHK